MKQNNLYDYDKNDLILHPQKYQLSTFHGQDFLLDYKNSRIQKISFLKNSVTKISTLDEISKNLDDFIKHYIFKDKQIKETEKILTKIFLEELKKNNGNHENLTNIYLKKFEIKKRLYTSYDENFKENSNDYSNLRNYILLSAICILKYENSKNLKFLNTSLKINDTICSRIKNLDDDLEKSLVIHILTMEIKKITELCHLKKIMIK